MNAIKKLARTTEFWVAMTVAGLCLVIGLKSPAFFTVQNWFDLARSSVELGILALGFFLVLASGGIDVSFGAIALFSMMTSARILTALEVDAGVLPAFAIGAAVGLLLGMFNAVFISLFRVPTLIATLGTASIFRGAMLIFVSYKIITSLPDSWSEFGKATLVTVTNAAGQPVGLSASVLILAVAALLVWAVLRFTMAGRGVYALGGDPVAARRAGFHITGIQLLVYGLSGALAGTAGIVHATSTRMANPFDYMGIEMVVIAAVVLGGARISGGHGSVIGTLLGVLLVTIMNNSLILLGVSSYWQRVVIGALILIGTGVAAYQANRDTRPSVLDS